MPACVTWSRVHRVLGALRDRRLAEQRCAMRPTTTMRNDARDEDVGRQRERLARLADAAEVHRGEHDHDRDRHLDPHPGELRDRGDDVVDAGGDRHRHGEDVVDEQRGRDDQRGPLAEVLLRDLVVAAARRVGLDELPVGQHDHHEQQHDDRGDPGAKERNAVRRAAGSAAAPAARRPPRRAGREAKIGSARCFGSSWSSSLCARQLLAQDQAFDPAALVLGAEVTGESVLSGTNVSRRGCRRGSAGPSAARTADALSDRSAIIVACISSRRSACATAR